VPQIPWFVYAMLLAPFGLIAVAIAVKLLQQRAAAAWPSTPGTVVASRSELRKVKVLDDSREALHRFERRNFASIVYEYQARGRRLRGNRVGIGEDRGNVGVAETLARYPVGTPVTVYYDPLHPERAVLERELPPGLGGVAISAGVVLTVVVVVLIGVADGAHLARPNLSVPVAVMAGIGAVAGLFALALGRRAAAARRWSVVEGRIWLDGVEAFRAAPSASGRRGALLYRREVHVDYHYGGVAYRSLHGSLDSNTAEPSPRLLALFGLNYQAGEAVAVFVNPVNPAQMTLAPRTRAAWLLAALMLTMWAGAYAIAAAS